MLTVSRKRTLIYCSISAGLALLLVARPSDALRMINLDVPATAFQGDTIELSCSYSLRSAIQNHEPYAQDPAKTKSFPGYKPNSTLRSGLGKQEQEAAGDSSELLYAVKWYKEEREFFRYLAQDWPRKQSLPMEGVVVDVEQSDNHTVVLRNVSLLTSGPFRCEVSTDAPSFMTKSIERHMLIYSLPNEGPVIESQTHDLKGSRYSLGEHIELKCSASESKPVAILDWIINDTLNLSSNLNKSLVADLLPGFKVEDQRFVRIPSINVSGNLAKSQSHLRYPNQLLYSSRQQQQMSSPISYTTYELRNKTLAVPYQRDSTNLTIMSLAGGSLDKLLEISTSKLNFTVDINLLQLLTQQTKLDPSIPNVSKLKTSNRVSRSSGNRGSSAHSSSAEATTYAISTEPSSSHSTIEQSKRSSSMHLSRDRTAIPSTFNDYSKPSNVRSSSLAHVKGKKNHKSAAVTFGGGSTNDNNKHLLKIRCVARVLDLSMSDEIKLRPVHKAKHSAAELSPSEPQPRQRPNGRNSCGKGSIEPSYQNILLVALIVVALEHIHV